MLLCTKSTAVYKGHSCVQRLCTKGIPVYKGHSCAQRALLCTKGIPVPKGHCCVQIALVYCQHPPRPGLSEHTLTLTSLCGRKCRDHVMNPEDVQAVWRPANCRMRVVLFKSKTCNQTAFLQKPRSPFSLGVIDFSSSFFTYNRTGWLGVKHQVTCLFTWFAYIWCSSSSFLFLSHSAKYIFIF